MRNWGTDVLNYLPYVTQLMREEPGLFTPTLYYLVPLSLWIPSSEVNDENAIKLKPAPLRMKGKVYSSRQLDRNLFLSL